MKKIILLIIIVTIHLTISAKEIVGVLYNSGSVKISKLYSIFEKDLTQKGLKVVPVPLEKNEKRLLENIKLNRCDYIFSIGVFASKVALKSDLPGVFSLVPNPVEIELVDKNYNPKTKLSGIFMKPNIGDLIQKLKLITDKRFKIGVIYNPNYSQNYVNQFFDKISSTNYILLPEIIFKPDEVAKSLKNFKGKINLLFGIVDYTVFNRANMRLIMMFSIKNKIPLIGISDAMTRSGAFCSFYFNFEDIAKKASNMIYFISQNAEEDLKPTMEYPQLRYSINKNTADIMKIKLNPEAVKNADKMY